jgi:hypothetical protein
VFFLTIPLSLTQNLLFAIGIIVANVPEALLPTVPLSLAIGAQRMALWFSGDARSRLILEEVRKYFARRFGRFHTILSAFRSVEILASGGR